MLGTLNVSQSGLNAAKVAVENVSNNIANENTPGYKKRVVQLSELDQNDNRVTGRGVSSSSAYRITSQYMYENILSENSKLNAYDKLSSTLANVESIFKETENSGFSADLNRYLQSVENLRANPNSEVAKTTLKNEGNSLVESLQNIYSGIEKQQSLEEEDLNANVVKINDILQEIGHVNEKLSQYSSSSNDLLDKRDQLEKELSMYTDIDVSTEDGEYELKIAGTTAVRYSTNVRALTIEEEKTPQIDKYVNDDGSNLDITFDEEDIISYKINNEFEVSVKYGDAITFDINEDGIIDTNDGTVDESNYLRVLVNEINTTTGISNLVKAYNGNYETDSEGNKTELYPNQDNFLLIESKIDGSDGNFEGRITVVKQSDSDLLDSTNELDVDSRTNFFAEEDYSSESESRTFLSIYDSEITVKSGILKPQLDNLDSTSYNNKIQNYKDKLDSFAQTLSDLSDKYIKTGDDEYLYGDTSIDSDNDYLTSTVHNIGLFSGGSVMSLTFNENSVNDLEQNDLDYLATLQWKKDISFTGKEQNPDDTSVSSLSEFFQDIRINVSSDKESNDFLLSTQEGVQQALESAHDELTKVDSDEEMINLIKFQAAYSANAKIITVIDEMLQTLLGLKR
ncbi:flagellar hook-associated protein FlgK [Poseidonibacter ostreae]|jgi:flagellar hook-associated protein 1|uniref:Flagellar hook-associated protein 1 n=1 Tax=Poseidonibacter ostreae TaxID=2654171 RepID=A0A6L4WR24_9BACT|nr:flagellar basal body rod C-terminal domain-containing protein [Poseidonibacter ostreae]KAB7884408.1 flagellar hook-associated protein FlgK [Poseidonibacter ostreae]KAB7885939.1 flagellar hook-associated protein FlgK [Poseidonibacter ostreae]KAB7886655.1 flagellar hook-associated protein FlgK [Poseidonibacter ostreae]MAC83346.1 flagellar biosynthesis protein FlgK [Arcobacter sp.]|tara:strand:+ start:3844 stop:5721 length:1878 start_codon:yes stop_codon:yes gene_type:complete